MSLQWGMFFLGASGESAARVPVAAMGSALALVPFLLRRRPADFAMLGLAALLAFDPLLVERSRHADGAMPAAFLAAVTLAFLWRFRHGGNTVWAHGAGLAGGLLLVSGRDAWAWLPIPIVAGAVLRAMESRPLPVGVARTFAAAALLGGTAAMAAPAFFGGVSASLTGWLAGCSDVGGSGFPGRDLLRFARAEPLPIALAVIALVAGARRVAWMPLSLAAAAWGLIVMTLPGGAPTGGVIVVLALFGAASAWIELAFVPRAQPLMDPRVRAFVLAVAAVLIVARGGAAMATLGTVRTAPVTFRLAEDLRRLGSHRAGDPAELPVDVLSTTGPDPTLAWALRDFRRLRWVSAPDLNPPAEGALAPVVVVAERDSPRPDLSATHLGARYRDFAGSAAGNLVLWVPHAR
jgi:hypothetical protein